MATNPRKHKTPKTTQKTNKTVVKPCGLEKFYQKCAVAVNL